MTPEILELRRRESIALVCYQEGLSLHESDPEGAENCYRQVIDAIPDHVGAMCGLASIHIDKKRIGLARETLVAVLQICPGHEFALLELARLCSGYQSAWRLTCAAALYAKALVSDLDNTEAADGLRESMRKLSLSGQCNGHRIVEVGLDRGQMIKLLAKVCRRLRRNDERFKSCHALKNLLTQTRGNLAAIENRRRPPAPANVSNAPEVTASA